MPDKKRFCRNCFCGIWKEGDCLLASGYICHLNPLKPVAMGIMGECSERKANKMEQYLPNKLK